MVSGTIFVFLIGGIDLSIATLCAFSAVVVVSVTHMLGDTPGAVIAGVFAALLVGALAGAKILGIRLADYIPYLVPYIPLGHSIGRILAFELI